MTTSWRVIADWQASYPDPIRLAKGEPLALSGRTDLWEGHLWLWARDREGREGWVPDTLVDHGSGGPVAAFDYCAMELTCRQDEVLSGGRQLNGWIWCRAAGGAEGCVPAAHLAAVAPAQMPPPSP
ncbi:SH3 domain-containing protein [Rhizobium sp. CSW-27]|uniref:SH3 domain-containing protein n=1 Tax=Rhizobium sp. CSW-27 TaxID=2839985 RepID=UPI001C00B71B|nr:SH3 domain-containing protein [Rhizobium sp. CSW-27]MBT9371405.1 SH3 domain-containing protein [Rhizobium sp. CSW-27]